MVRAVTILLVVLALYWALLSGYMDKPVLLTLGAISIAVVLGLCFRMRILDSETTPYIHGKALGYYVWLFIEIVKSNMTVVKTVIAPDMVISPKLTKVPMRQSTDMGRVTFANSITLTPGTIAVEMKPDHILVHALLGELTDPAGFAEMGERAGWAVSDPMMGEKGMGEKGMGEKGMAGKVKSGKVGGQK